MSNANPYTIPIVDLRSQYHEIQSDIRGAIDEVLETQQFILGPAVQKFEEQMAAYLQCRHAVGVASGSDALLLALMALDIGPGDGVVVTPLTFFSTVSSITRLGATPLFVDIDFNSYLLSVNSVESFLAQRGRFDAGRMVDAKTGRHIRTLLPVHLFGRCCEMAEFQRLAEKYGLSMVEDVAQACGARANVTPSVKFAGTVGNIGCFSFFPSKNLGGYGDGGLVTTSDGKLADKIRMLRVHGESSRYHHDITGINSRLDSIQAAVLAVKQHYLERWCELRIERALTYHRLFTESGLPSQGLIHLPAAVTDKSHVFNNYVVRAMQRDGLKRFLADHGIQSEVYYPLPLHLQPCFAALGYEVGDFPLAEQAAKEVLALPIYPELTLSQQEFIVQIIRAYYGR